MELGQRAKANGPVKVAPRLARCHPYMLHAALPRNRRMRSGTFPSHIDLVPAAGQQLIGPIRILLLPEGEAKDPRHVFPALNNLKIA